MLDQHDRGVSGAHLVELLRCVECGTYRMEHLLPSVDHLSMRRRDPDPDEVLAGLRLDDSAELIETFEVWRRRIDAFYSAASELMRLRDGTDATPDSYQHKLDLLIGEVRQRRADVEAAADAVRREIARRIDMASSRPASRAAS